MIYALTGGAWKNPEFEWTTSSSHHPSYCNEREKTKDCIFIILATWKKVKKRLLKSKLISCWSHIESVSKHLIGSPAKGSAHEPPEGNGWRKGSRESRKLIHSEGRMKSGWRTKLSSLSSWPGYTSTQERHT